MSKDGTYGKRKRQRFRCTSEDGTFHRFVPALPRHHVVEGVCATCDNTVHTHEGPVAMLKGCYEVREMAAALIEVSGGTSYTEAARRVRTNYWGIRGTGRLGANSVESGQTVADWLNQFGPVLTEHYAEVEWPETVILDSTEYQFTNPRTGRPQQLFVIMCAWGYEAGVATGRLWHVEAHPTDKKADWVEFLRALPGTPKSVVYDGDRAIGPAITTRWRGAVPAHVCEHHLYVNASKALQADGHDEFGDAHNKRLNEAFQTSAKWKRYRDGVIRAGLPTSAKWVSHWDKKLSAQTARRSSIPAHYSTGPLDRAIATLRQWTESRKWTFRNAERMNQLLGLMRLRINRLDNQEAWAEIIRVHLNENGGAPVRPRKLADPTTYDAAGRRVYSLRT